MTYASTNLKVKDIDSRCQILLRSAHGIKIVCKSIKELNKGENSLEAVGIIKIVFCVLAFSFLNGDFGDIGPSGASGRVCAAGRNLGFIPTKESD